MIYRRHWTSMLVFIVYYTIAYSFKHIVLWFEWSILFNLILLSLVIIVGLWLFNRLRALHMLLQELAFIIITFLVLVFINSTFISWVESSDDMDNNAKGMSAVILLPLAFVASIVWGVLVDRFLYKKQTKSKTT